MANIRLRDTVANYYTGQGVKRGIPSDQLMAEAKRLIAEIEEANPHLKKAQSGPSVEMLEEQIRTWKKGHDSLLEALLKRENELMATRQELLEVRRKSVEKYTTVSGFNPYPNQPVTTTQVADPRDWSGDATWSEPSAFAFTEQSRTDKLLRKTGLLGSDEYLYDGRFTRFVNHPATRWVTFLTMCVLGGAYMVWKGGW